MNCSISRRLHRIHFRHRTGLRETNARLAGLLKPIQDDTCRCRLAISRLFSVGSVDSVSVMSLSHQANPKASHATSGSAKDDGVVVRPFCMKDYEDVFALWRRSEGVELGASDTRAAIAAYVRRNPGLSFVAHRKGQLVGTVLCGHDGRRGYLHHLAVSKRHRRAGLGRRLVDKCLERLRRIDIHKCNIFVFADNLEGMTFWTRTGWTPRPDLRLLQIDLSGACSRKRSC